MTGPPFFTYDPAAQPLRLPVTNNLGFRTRTQLPTVRYARRRGTQEVVLQQLVHICTQHGQDMTVTTEWEDVPIVDIEETG